MSALTRDAHGAPIGELDVVRTLRELPGIDRDMEDRLVPAGTRAAVLHVRLDGSLYLEQSGSDGVPVSFIQTPADQVEVVWRLGDPTG